jgi:tetratricopeptide (TPR) repeat protein
MAAAIRHGETGMAADDAVLSAAILGAGLPEMAAWHLRRAARAYRNERISEAHLLRAQAIAPTHAAVLIGLYRFYFYRNRLAEAFNVAKLCLRKAARDNALPLDWRSVSASGAAFGDYAAVLPRFYLFTLKAAAYLSMRLGDLSQGRAMVTKLLELDPSDKIGAKVLLGILDRMGIDDDE